MLLIPAIDIQQGKCVRLRQGDFNNSTVFSEDLLAMAWHWAEQGAERLHIVDLDGAKSGEPIHFEAIKQITQDLPDIDIQIGGGIRTAKTVAAYLDAGVRFVILGTWALVDSEATKALINQYPGQVILGLDAKDNKVATEGWLTDSNTTTNDVLAVFKDEPLAAVVYTDIAKDGMMQGANIERTAELARSTNIPFILSGGVTNMRDLHLAKACQSSGIMGAIIGRALYEGEINFREAIKALDAQRA